MAEIDINLIAEVARIQRIAIPEQRIDDLAARVDRANAVTMEYGASLGLGVEPATFVALLGRLGDEE